MNQAPTPSIYGLVASYDTPEALLKAAERVRDAGYTHTDALTPFPVHGIVDALGIPKSKMASLVFLGAAVGCLTGFGLRYWVSVITYPHIVSGRPLFSWPNFIPVIFECNVLFAGLTAFIGMLNVISSILLFIHLHARHCHAFFTSTTHVHFISLP